MHKLDLKESSKIIWNTYVIQILLTLTQLYITRVGGGTVFLYTGSKSQALYWILTDEQLLIQYFSHT